MVTIDQLDQTRKRGGSRGSSDSQDPGYVNEQLNRVLFALDAFKKGDVSGAPHQAERRHLRRNRRSLQLHGGNDWRGRRRGVAHLESGRRWRATSRPAPRPTAPPASGAT
ncbi:MAG: hypothetical protein WKG07_47625 [Hymenobacter sp.]